MEQKSTFKQESPPRQIPITMDMVKDGTLFSSQDWVEGHKVSKAVAYNNGNSTYKSLHPSAYVFHYHGRECYLIGDGHHRISDALDRGIPISATTDINLGEIDDDLMRNKNKIQQRFAIFGIETIMPFQYFLNKFINVSSNRG